MLTMPDPLRYPTSSDAEPIDSPPVKRSVLIRHALALLDKRISEFAVAKPLGPGDTD